MARKSKVRIPTEKGHLPGYFLHDTRAHRRMVLKKLAKKDTWGKIVKRLNVLYIYNKNKHPENAGKFKRDMQFIQKEYSPNYSSKKRSIKRSRKMSHKRSIKRSRKMSHKRSIKRSRKMSR